MGKLLTVTLVAFTITGWYFFNGLVNGLPGLDAAVTKIFAVYLGV